MNASFVSESILTPALFVAEPSHIISQAIANIHAGDGVVLSTINLQMISDIRFTEARLSSACSASFAGGR